MTRHLYNLKLLLKFSFLGALIGVFFLHPLTMVIYWIEFNPPEALNLSLIEFVFKKMMATFSSGMSLMTFIFSGTGVCLGLIFWLYHSKLATKERMINLLFNEIEKDIPSLVRQGESETLEFKSSLRWDYKQDKLNKDLEFVIVRTIAGFMNNRGGTLLIGIDDEGKPLGLEHDYGTLKRKNRDGFEQLIVALVSSYLGADLCAEMSVMFPNFQSKEICRASVSPSSRPVYCQDNNKTQFFLRTGGGTRELNVKEATEYINHRWLVR